MILSNNSNKIIFLISFTVILIVAIITSDFLFSLDDNSVWTKADKLNWLRSCASLGRDEEKCKCILGQLEIMYPSKQKMDIEMKKNPAAFSHSMISANKECD